MSGIMEQLAESHSKNSKRGSVNNKGRLAAFKKADRGRSADWGGCSELLVHSVVVKITTLGGAVMFGVSRDGGGHSLTLMLDGGKEVLWFNGNADLDEALQEVIETLESMS